MIVLLTNYLLVTSLASHNVLHGATIGSSQAPDTSPLLSLHMEAISALYSHTDITVIILIVLTTVCIDREKKSKTF